MSTKLHSFIDIFETTFEDGNKTVELKKIIIPIIQRDYAQGRQDPIINRVRSRFLSSLYDAIVKNSITLDFVYGDIDSNGVMTPLDGQQRLTTLFLLHWYAARKKGISNEECSFLANFGYETRYSARYFCKDLIQFIPSFKGKLSAEIIDQAWFPLDWKKDPTISSMLNMLDAIDDKFKDIKNLWDRLREGAITFYFLPIKDMGLTDELYIKMNSRGKPLTKFEHFKAELERCISDVNASLADRIMRKIDRDWTDMLWLYRNSGSDSEEDIIIDDEFLRYFHFICDVLCYLGGESPQGKSSDEFDLLTAYFTGESKRVLRNIDILESYFDCWCKIKGYNCPADFLNSCMSYKHENEKIIVDKANKIDILEDCLYSYADIRGRQRKFPLNRIILLYAVINYLLHQDDISREEYIRRLRSINNLIQNSEDEISDRIDRNRIPAILKQVNAIMLQGSIDKSIEINFNANQIDEEKQKKKFLQEHPNQISLLYALEDHPYLKGQISIIGLDHLDYADRFGSLFSCNLDLIDCAMMTIGNYSQREQNRWRYQFASHGMQIAWYELFHKSGNIGFENTSAILVELLSKADTFTNELLSQMIDEFITSCEEANLYPWRYYYVKYNSFRPGRYGKFSNRDVQKEPYLFSVMQTKSQLSSSTYMPYFKEADETHLSRDYMGQRLVYDKHYIICHNSEYLLIDSENDKAIKTFKIQQNIDGIDIEDRILLLKRIIPTVV